jgi:hypothetical protein
MHAIIPRGRSRNLEVPVPAHKSAVQFSIFSSFSFGAVVANVFEVFVFFFFFFWIFVQRL